MKKLLFVLITVSLVSPVNLVADAWDPPSSYYDNATGSGDALKSQLTLIMTINHIQREYDDFRSSAAITDQDPDNSNNILLCYTRDSVPARWDSGKTWSREHVWPQSRQPGSADPSTKGNLGDPHALLPIDPSINSSRSNKPFKGIDWVGDARHNGNYYFPGDADKGDVARSLFYSATRWSSKRLTLVEGFPYVTYSMGDLASLLRWHYMDVPDTFERRRNHTIYSRAYNRDYYTNNRNAYIDHPEFVWSVFGGNDNDTMLYVESAHEPNGFSSVEFDLGSIYINSAYSLPSVTVTLNKIGEDGTYYEITKTSNVNYSGVPSGFKAFDYGTHSKTLRIRINEIPDMRGQYTETVTINNLDVCGNSPEGRGSNDRDDVITIHYTVLSADITDDGLVDLDDLMGIAANWLEVVPEWNIDDGVNDEPGILNLVDFSVLASEWNN